MNISGVGIIFSRGVGVTNLEKALVQGWQEPEAVPIPRCAGQSTPVYQVNLDKVADKTLLKKIRRSDKLSKMCVVAAADACADAQFDDWSQKKIGVILATAFGPHVTTFNFLDGILDYGDAAVSPTMFSNSVHNAATSYITMSLDIKGPAMTITQFRFSFQAAMQLASAWLDEERCEYVLLGAVDQYGDVLGYVAGEKLTTAKDGRIKPFTFKPTCQVPGEGAVFFLVSKKETSQDYCTIEKVSIYDDHEEKKAVDLTIIDADGMLPDESAYLGSLAPGALVTSYSPLFGSMMIGGAFNLAAAALMMKKQMLYSAPVLDNPHNLKLVNETRQTQITAIRSIACNCFGEKSVVYVTRR
jgi:3-oxoacyl-[acyl-carrier-protein] synthase II